jgi:hypothetical protein
MIEISEITAELQRLIRMPCGDMNPTERRRHEIYLLVFARIVREMTEAGLQALPDPSETQRRARP